MDELSAIPQASRDVAQQRFELLRPNLEEQRPLRVVASEASIPYRTAVRWVSGYRKDGLSALARKSRTDQGERRLASAQLIRAIEGLAFERPPLPISSIHRQASAMAEVFQERKPSYAVVRRIVWNLPAGLLMLAHRGNRAYSEGFDLVHRREALTGRSRLIFSTPGQPQGRGRIERFFRTANDIFLCDLDGYTTRRGRKPTLTLDSLKKQFHTFLLEVYHRRPSSEGKLSPKERWEHGGFLPRMPDSLEHLDLLLIYEVRARRVRPDGIHFQTFRYLSLTLAAYVGEDVTIRFDPRDMGEIRVFYRERFLCRAISADLAGQTVPLREIVNERKRRREQLLTIVKDRLKTVDTLLKFRRGMQREDLDASTAVPVAPSPSKLKRYYNE